MFDAEEFLTTQTQKVAHEMAAKTDEWLRRVASDLGITVEELAERYELEDHGLEWSAEADSETYRARQTWRLKRRDEVQGGQSN